MLDKKPVTAHLPDVSQPIDGYIAKRPKTLSVEIQGGGTPSGGGGTSEWTDVTSLFVCEDG